MSARPTSAARSCAPARGEVSDFLVRQLVTFLGSQRLRGASVHLEDTNVPQLRGCVERQAKCIDPVRSLCESTFSGAQSLRVLFSRDLLLRGRQQGLGARRSCSRFGPSQGCIISVDFDASNERTWNPEWPPVSLGRQQSEAAHANWRVARPSAVSPQCAAPAQRARRRVGSAPQLARNSRSRHPHAPAAAPSLRAGRA